MQCQKRLIWTSTVCFWFTKKKWFIRVVWFGIWTSCYVLQSEMLGEISSLKNGWIHGCNLCFLSKNFWLMRVVSKICLHWSHGLFTSKNWQLFRQSGCTGGLLFTLFCSLRWLCSHYFILHGLLLHHSEITFITLVRYFFAIGLNHLKGIEQKNLEKSFKWTLQ